MVNSKLKLPSNLGLFLTGKRAWLVFHYKLISSLEFEILGLDKYIVNSDFLESFSDDVDEDCTKNCCARVSTLSLTLFKSIEEVADYFVLDEEEFEKTFDVSDLFQFFLHTL